jgi:hypothetical protein
MIRSSVLFAILGCMLALPASRLQAGLVIAGSFQGWNPPDGVVMNDDGGGLYSATIAGLNPGDNHEFKILDDAGNPPANWGAPEWTLSNNWFRVEGDGSVTIRVNTNIGAPGENNLNVGISSGGWTPQLVGDFMEAAGGAGNWNPSDASFNMTNVGGNQWQHIMTIANPGTYFIKVTDGSGWDRQFGSNGFHNNPDSFSFTTLVANEQVIVNFDSLNPSFSVVPEPASSMLVAAGLVVTSLVRRRRA